MKATRKKSLIVFLIGSLLGILLSIPLFLEHKWHIDVFFDNEFLRHTYAFDILRPGFIAWYGLAFITNSICFLFNSELCRGMAFDGGPLEFLEWIFVYFGMVIGYGLILLGLYKLLIFIKRTKKTVL